MLRLLFAVVWWIGLVSIAVGGGVIVTAAVVSIRDRVWDRDRRRHIAECERRERPRGIRATSFELCEQLWGLPAAERVDD